MVLLPENVRKVLQQKMGLGRTRKLRLRQSISDSTQAPSAVTAKSVRNEQSGRRSWVHLDPGHRN